MTADLDLIVRSDAGRNSLEARVQPTLTVSHSGPAYPQIVAKDGIDRSLPTRDR